MSKTVSSQQQRPAQRVRNKAKTITLVYASLLAQALEGKFGPYLQGYYDSAVKHHTAKATVFPRAHLSKVQLMSPTEAVAFLHAHKAERLPSGNVKGQRLFDEMMIQRQA